MVRKESADPKLTVSCGPHCRNTIMKLTKNAAALLLAASLAVSVCAMPVFAYDMGSQKRDNTNTIGNSGVVAGSTNVYYKVTERYAWSIPATIDFGEDAGVKNTSTVEANKDGDGTKAVQDGTAWKGTAPKVCVTENVIGFGKTLKIAVDTERNYADTFDTTENKFYVQAPKMTKAGASTTEFEKLYFTIAKTAAGQTAMELNTADNEVMSVPSGTNKKEQTLEFKLETTTETAEKAGDYVGCVYFFSKVEPTT